MESNAKAACPTEVFWDTECVNHWCLWDLSCPATNKSVNLRAGPTNQTPVGLSPQNRVFCSSRWGSVFLCSSDLFPFYLFSSSPTYQLPTGRQAFLLVLGFFSSSCCLLSGTFSAFLISPCNLLSLSHLLLTFSHCLD